MSTITKPQSAGGKATALILRKQALERYYENPNLCKNCGSIIPVRDNQKIRETRQQSFCNKSCYGEYQTLRARTCKKCCEQFKIGRQNNGAVSKTLVCQNCKPDDISTLTKGQIFSIRKNWQSARSHIQKAARKLFKTLNPQSKCEVCGYTAHVEVAHRQSVSSFSNNSLISEINDIKNLVGLCPNHHWEFDNGLLQL